MNETANQAGTSPREAVAVFHDAASLERAVDALESSGFDRADLSVLASWHAVEEKFGRRYRKVQDLEDVPDAPAIAYVSRNAVREAEGSLVSAFLYIGAMTAAGAVVASGGTLAAAIAATAAAGYVGATIGALIARFIAREHAERLAEQVERGGLLLWVRTRDEAHEEHALDILRRHGGEHVHLHELAEAAVAGADTAARMEALIDQALQDTFPASDAPSFTPATPGSPRRDPTRSD
jgi:hypothetical protein